MIWWAWGLPDASCFAGRWAVAPAGCREGQVGVESGAADVASACRAFDRWGGGRDVNMAGGDQAVISRRRGG